MYFIVYQNLNLKFLLLIRVKKLFFTAKQITGVQKQLAFFLKMVIQIFLFWRRALRAGF